MLGTNRGILAKTHLVFHKEKLISYANVFYLVNAEIVCRKDFALMFLILHQLQQGILYTEIFLIYFENFYFLVYHIKHHHVKMRFNKRSVSKAFFGTLTESLLIRPINLPKILHLLFLPNLYFYEHWQMDAILKSQLQCSETAIQRCSAGKMF